MLLVREFVIYSASLHDISDMFKEPIILVVCKTKFRYQILSIYNQYIDWRKLYEKPVRSDYNFIRRQKYFYLTEYYSVFKLM